VFRDTEVKAGHKVLCFCEARCFGQVALYMPRHMESLGSLSIPCWPQSLQRQVTLHIIPIPCCSCGSAAELQRRVCPSAIKMVAQGLPPRGLEGSSVQQDFFQVSTLQQAQDYKATLQCLGRYCAILRKRYNATPKKLR